jgi:hypothetical protein
MEGAEITSSGWSTSPVRLRRTPPPPGVLGLPRQTTREDFIPYRRLSPQLEDLKWTIVAGIVGGS